MSKNNNNGEYFLNNKPFSNKVLYKASLSDISGIQLTQREVDVIACILNNRGDKKIAFLLSISPKTVSTHIRNITSKIRASSREQVIDFVEKSEKKGLFQQYYKSLMLEITFEEHLKNIKNTINNQGLTYNFNISEITGNTEILMRQIISHLKSANCTFTPTNSSVKHFLVVYDKKNAIAFILKISNKENNLENKVHFDSSKNYYFILFEILENLLCKDLSQVIKSFKTEHDLFIDDNSETSSKTIFIRNTIPIFKYTAYASIIFSFFLFIGSGFYFSHVAQESNSTSSTHLKNILQSPWNVPYIPLMYVERVGIKDKLITKLNSKNENALNQVALVGLYGMGGVGKTYLALDYIYNTKVKYKFKGWLAANDKSRLRADYIKLGVDLGLYPLASDEDRNVVAVKEWLNKQKKVLLVFDNAQDLNVIQRHLNSQVQFS